MLGERAPILTGWPPDLLQDLSFSSLVEPGDEVREGEGGAGAGGWHGCSGLCLGGPVLRWGFIPERLLMMRIKYWGTGARLFGGEGM